MNRPSSQPRPRDSRRVPVIILSGFLGAGKTTLLNHLLRSPDARLGVVVNDFGDINVDAALVTGEVDEPASIAGGCLCCLPPENGIDPALRRLSDPRLRLDAILVEASGVAEPLALARLVRRSSVPRVRPGGLVEVVDAIEYFRTIDVRVVPPVRFAAATLIAINKVDALADDEREEMVARITARIRARNPAALIVQTSHARIDPGLVFDVVGLGQPDDQLPLAGLLAEPEDDAAPPAGPGPHGHHAHIHADAVTVPATAPIDPGRLIDLLEDPPADVYRLKGVVPVRTARRTVRYGINLVGPTIDIEPHPARIDPDALGLVAIGVHLDAEQVRTRLQAALAPADAAPGSEALLRLGHYLRLSEG